jgi:hypothetical protein
MAEFWLARCDLPRHSCCPSKPLPNAPANSGDLKIESIATLDAARVISFGANIQPQRVTRSALPLRANCARRLVKLVIK